MFEWLGKLVVRVKKKRLVVVGVDPKTHWAGALLCLLSLPVALLCWGAWPPLVIFPSVFFFVGALALSFRRTLVFNQDDGVLRIEERILGLGTNIHVPLFHLRAVVVHPSSESPSFRPSYEYLARIDRRVGEPIHLETSKRSAPLLKLAEAISDIAEIRLEYETRASWSKRN